ncbi:hypothetical protein [Nocardioides kribbensis]|uniref:Uncharacterized protein n=1 Tax=Nocardioides kribbensis TaxID=305517 RepID=A0ABV1NY56_9ACTN
MTNAANDGWRDVCAGQSHFSSKVNDDPRQPEPGRMLPLVLLSRAAIASY